eukprot:TRINITY_DN50950_c0_g1_i1.p1 TRINITY_DN50950_c0_g1~~TRINITY_DN50950_c0_g1_i1.p1  ORF type:complete len:482 (+),score=92.82 TRINITY_DN50950_c0_g1_i1:51-1496(+)
MGRPKPSTAPHLADEGVHRRAFEAAGDEVTGCGQPAEVAAAQVRSRSRSRRRKSWSFTAEGCGQVKPGSASANNQTKKLGRKGSGPPTKLFAQAYIGQHPAEFGEDEIKQMHLDLGVDEQDLPISVKLLSNNSSSRKSKTSSCIARYENEAMLERVVAVLDGRFVMMQCGKRTRLAVKKAKPACWMVRTGRAKDNEEDQVQPADPNMADAVTKAQTALSSRLKRRARETSYEPPPLQGIEDLAFFCETWELDNATAAWLGRLHPDVQQTVVDEYDDSTRVAPVLQERVLLQPSLQLSVALPPDLSSKGLIAIFGRFGAVERFQLLPGKTSVLVTMRSLEEATMAVEDLTLQVPHGLQSPLSVCFAASDPKTKDQVPFGRLLLGRVKIWNAATSYGLVSSVFGDMAISGSDCFWHSIAAVTGQTVLFTAKQSPANPQKYMVESCISDPETVLNLLTSSSKGWAVRQFARQVQLRLQQGTSAI